MSPRTKPPAVVAELGRPETPDETAARRAGNSADHRNRQTVNNLVYSLIATVALVAVIVLVVPRGNPATSAPVDYASIAAEAQGSEPDRMLVPALPAGWTSNNAQLRSKTPDNVDSWYIGLLTPKKQFVALTQGFTANDSWVADQVNKSMIKGTTTIGGITWDVYDNRDSGGDNGNVDYALVTHAASSSIILFGTAANDEFRTVATSLADQIHRLEGS